MQIKSNQLICKRCGHIWWPRQNSVTRCPVCKTKLWYKEKQMTIQEKHDAICSMRSLGTLTSGKHPSLTAFKYALRDGRVCGDYDKRIVIASMNPRFNYTFIKEQNNE